MKKYFTLLLIAVFSLTTMAQQKKVAVYVAGEQSGISKVLGDQLVAAFAKSGKYIAVERTSSFLAELGREQGYQRTGAGRILAELYCCSLGRVRYRKVQYENGACASAFRRVRKRLEGLQRSMDPF